MKDTSHFIQSVRELTIPIHALFFTIDIDSLYTNIPIHAGIKAVENVFQQYPDPSRPDQELLQLLYINLTKNDFIFDGKFYLQTKGTAMGKRFAPAYANIFMADWETKALAKSIKKPLHYLRYLDDIFGIWVDSESEFNDFIILLNTFDPSIKLKHTQSYQSVDFLDTTVFKGPEFHITNKVDLKVYFKPTDTHALLHKTSFHPKCTFAGIVKSQLIRFSRICTRHSDFILATQVLFKSLRKRGYSRTFLRRCFNTFQSTKSKTQDQLIPLITTFSTPTVRLNRKIKNNFKIHITESGLIPNHSVISAYKKNKNLKDILVRASLPPPKKPLKEKTSIQDIFQKLQFVKSHHTSKIFPISQFFSPHTSNIIYLIYCDICGKQYVGQTQNTLLTRFTQHRYNILRHHKTQTPLVKHFLYHGLGAVRLAGLQSASIWTKIDRLKNEYKWIKNLSTLHPHGLNIYGSFR